MKDARGEEIKEGDTVAVWCKIRALHPITDENAEERVSLVPLDAPEVEGVVDPILIMLPPNLVDLAQ